MKHLWYTKRRRAQNPNDFETWIVGGVSPTLNAFDNTGDSRATVLILDGTRVDDIRVYDDEITPCLKNRMGTGGNNVPFVAFASNQRSEVRDIGDVAIALQAEPGMNQQTFIAQETTHTVAYPIEAYDEYNDQIGGDIHHAIRAGTKQSTGVLIDMQVRRLTPIECERLMGWPDNHTLYRADGKTNSDTTRYKMCGNGVASPVAQWIAEQINQAEHGM